MNKNQKVERLEKLKQIVILKDLDTIDLNKKKNFYKKIIEKVMNGELNHSFLSESLKNTEKEDQKKAFDLAKKYKDLCFYQGNIKYWADSIGGIYLDDLDFVTMKILDNYDFLLGLAKEGGEPLLKELESFQNSTMSKEGSIIDYLRNSFPNDKVLIEVLLELFSKEGQFKTLNKTQKRILCTYPKGILFKEENHNIQKLSYNTLVKNIEKETELSTENFLKNNTKFEKAILNIHHKYCNN